MFNEQELFTSYVKADCFNLLFGVYLSLCGRDVQPCSDRELSGDSGRRELEK